jgi:prevent-host-death family protein
MAVTMTVSEARAALPAVLDRVEAGEEITITRHGRPVAIVRSADGRYHGRAAEAFAEAERLRVRLEAARDRPLSTGFVMTEERAEELIAAIRADRDSG